MKMGKQSIVGGNVLEYEAKMIRNEGMENGRIGTVFILKKPGIPSQTIRAKIQKQYDLTPEDSEKYL